MPVGRICSQVLATATPDETVRVAARRMVRNEVGTLVVLAGAGVPRPAGVVTDRDIALRCVGGDLDPDRTPISHLMSSPVHSLDEGAPVEDAVQLMASAGIRRLVVTGDGGRLVGLLSLDDVLEHLLDEAGPIRRLLEKQRPHVPA